MVSKLSQEEKNSTANIDSNYYENYNTWNIQVRQHTNNKTRQTKASQCYLPEQRAATPTTASSIAQSEQNIYVYHSIKIILLSGWQTSLTLLFCVLPLHFFVLYYIKSYLIVYMFWITKKYKHWKWIQFQDNAKHLS